MQIIYSLCHRAHGNALFFHSSQISWASRLILWLFFVSFVTHVKLFVHTYMWTLCKSSGEVHEKNVNEFNANWLPVHIHHMVYFNKGIIWIPAKAFAPNNLPVTITILLTQLNFLAWILDCYAYICLPSLLQTCLCFYH